jgi:hypothetical protein
MPSIEFILKVKKIKEDEIRRGWVRIPETHRRGIPSESLVKITNPQMGKSVLRIVLGVIPDNGLNTILMDENTREVLNIPDNQIDKEIPLLIKPYSSIGKRLHEVFYYYNHPDFPLRFSTRVAILLGSTSVILGLASLLFN